MVGEPTQGLPSGQMKLVEVNGERYAVAKLDGQYYAFADTCTHRGCSLSEGKIVAGTMVQCPCHGARFDIASGRVLGGPTQEPLKTAPVRVENGRLVVDV